MELLPAAPGELPAGALRPAPHRDDLDAALPDLAQGQLPLDPRLVELPQDTVNGGCRGGVPEFVGAHETPVPVVARIGLGVALRENHGGVHVPFLVADAQIELEIGPITRERVDDLLEGVRQRHEESVPARLESREMATKPAPEIETQYRVLREGVGIVDRSSRGKLDVLGPDAVAFLQGQVTNDIEALEPGHGCYAALLNPKGKILADLRALMVSNEELWLDTEEAALEVLHSTFDRYRIGRQVDLADRTHERGLLSLIGPGSREIAGVSAPLMKHSFEQVGIDGIDVLMVATEPGLDAVVPRHECERPLSALTERGAVPVSLEAAEIVRIESGRPRYGVDMTADNLPGEVGLELRAVSFTKGCYVGQEPVARMHYRGHPNRLLRGLLLSEPARPQEPVICGEREVGKVTSACISPALGPIALAVLRREVDSSDEVTVGAGGAAANVIELPFPRRR
jgi:tRNA-modifying protein YgfZ